MTRRRPLTAAVLVLLSTAPASAETLREAIADAYASNPTFAAAEARQDALTQTIEQARAPGRLSASASASAGYDRFNYGKAAIGTVGASLPIWTGGRVPSAVRATKADVASGAQTVRDSGAALIETVIQDYAALLYDQQSVAIAEADITLLDRQVAEAKSRFALGASTRTDVAQLEAQASSARAALADAQATLGTDAAAYAATVGHTPGTLVLPTDALPVLPGTQDQARVQAIAANPALLASERAAAAAAARIAVARSNGAPSLSLDGSYGYAETLAQSNVSSVPQASAAGLTFRLPILTGGLVRADVAQARANARAADFTVEAARREAVRGVDAAWAALAGARARIAADTAGVTAADLALRGVRAEYGFGLRTTLDILVADESLRAAQLALASDNSDALVTEAALLRATGRLAREVL